MPGDQPNRLARAYINVDKHKTRGGRLGTVYARTNWSVALGTTYTETYNQLAAVEAVPKFSGVWDADAKVQAQLFVRANLFLAYKYTGRHPGFIFGSGGNGEQTIQEVRTEAVHRLDLGTAFRLPAGFDLRLGVRNLLDERNRDTIIPTTGAAHTTGAVDWGRSLYLAAGWRSTR